MTIMELELVADKFFPKKASKIYLVAVSVIVDHFMGTEQSEAAKIEKEVCMYV